MTRGLLFPGGPGRITTPVEFDQIMNSLEQGLFTLPDETWVYPGHGDDTTIGAERPSIPEWRARGR
jgi:glyoxylase-like metal-dependent hydrolase (beta-lactamase superfamily II)